MSDGVTHYRRAVVPYQCIDDFHQCAGTFENPCEHSPAGKIVERSTRRTMTTPTSKEVSMRRFVLARSEDVSGTSGTGIVAEGVEFSNGQIAIHWISQLESVNVYANAKVLQHLHGHEGRTVVQWMDEDGKS